MNTKMPKIALGAWSWGTGAAGGDQVFGNHLSETELKPVFDKAMEWGLNLWDTAIQRGCDPFHEIYTSDCQRFTGCHAGDDRRQ